MAYVGYHVDGRENAHKASHHLRGVGRLDEGPEGDHVVEDGGVHDAVHCVEEHLQQHVGGEVAGGWVEARRVLGLVALPVEDEEGNASEGEDRGAEDEEEDTP